MGPLDGAGVEGFPALPGMRLMLSVLLLRIVGSTLRQRGSLSTTSEELSDFSRAPLSTSLVSTLSSLCIQLSHCAQWSENTPGARYLLSRYSLLVYLPNQVCRFSDHLQDLPVTMWLFRATPLSLMRSYVRRLDRIEPPHSVWYSTS